MQRAMQRARIRGLTSLLLAGVLALGLAGCGDDGGDEPAATDETTMDDDMDMGDDEDHADEEDGDHDEFAFGEPADAADADRTIEVDANDDLSYDPDAVDVAADETITFVVTNTGETVHEFTLGDQAAQDEHEAEMAEMMEEGEMMEHDEPNTLSLEPGETGELTWHFTGSGEVLYACHEPGHYAGGMIGSITVS